uniref:UDP-glucose 4-epimerase n=1 Tax=Steinernema glaseri TaxID=37863 RepID=A0A1I7Z5R4_9BILA
MSESHESHLNLHFAVRTVSLDRSTMHVLVTGAAGFIGSHTVLELLNAGYSVYAIDNFSNSIQDENGKAVSLMRVTELTGKDIPFEKVDVTNNTELEAVFKNHKFDAVIHLAALKAVGESVEKPLDYYSNNLIGSINLINCCRKYGVKSFVFSSSATVYGPPEKLPITEDCSTGQGITNPYGQTKYMMEQMLIDFAKAEKDWNVVLLRYFNPVGAHPSGLIGEDPKGIPNNLMPYVSQVAIGKLPVLTVYGDKFDTPDGTGVRDYIHIVDLAKGHVAALDRIKKEGNIGCEVYNLGTGKGYSVLEMVAALKKVSGRDIPTRMGVPRPGDVASVYCDPKLAEEMLGWKAAFGLEEMCRDLWNWQEKNPNGFVKN